MVKRNVSGVANAALASASPRSKADIFDGTLARGNGVDAITRDGDAVDPSQHNSRGKSQSLPFSTMASMP